MEEETVKHRPSKRQFFTVASIVSAFLLNENLSRDSVVYDDISSYVGDLTLRDFSCPKVINHKAKELMQLGKRSLADYLVRIIESENLEFEIKAIFIVTLYSVGISFAAKHFGFSNMFIYRLWSANLRAPLMEEFFYRTPFARSFLKGLSKRICKGAELDGETSLIDSLIFGFTHFPNKVLNLDKVIGAEVVSEIADEQGIAHSIVLHALWNSCITGAMFLGELILSPDYREMKTWLLPSSLLLGCMGGVVSVSLGIRGLRILNQNIRTRRLFKQIRRADTLKDIFAPQEIKDVARELLKGGILNNRANFVSGVRLYYHLQILELGSYVGAYQSKFIERTAQEKVILAVKQVNEGKPDLEERIKIVGEIFLTEV